MTSLITLPYQAGLAGIILLRRRYVIHEEHSLDAGLTTHRTELIVEAVQPDFSKAFPGSKTLRASERKIQFICQVIILPRVCAALPDRICAAPRHVQHT